MTSPMFCLAGRNSPVPVAELPEVEKPPRAPLHRSDLSSVLLLARGLGIPKAAPCALAEDPRVQLSIPPRNTVVPPEVPVGQRCASAAPLVRRGLRYLGRVALAVLLLQHAL